MLFHWHFNPVWLSLGPLQLHWYGLLFAAAFWQGDRWLRWFYRRENVDPAGVDQLLLKALIWTVVGARLVHCLFYSPAYYLAHPLEILMVWKGGLASHGGAIGLLLAMWHYARHAPVPSYLWLLDRVTIPATLGGALIRIANFLNAEILGKPTDGTWGVVFMDVDRVPRHPVQLYESLAYVLLCGLLLVIYRRRPREGVLTGTYLLLLFATRWALEYFKMPQASYEAGLAVSVGQWLSVPFMLVGAWLLLRARKAPPTASLQ